MTLSEAMAIGGVSTLTGLTIVFSVLIILMLVMMLMKKIFYRPNTPEKSDVTAAPTAPEPVKVSADDAELIAVLTAAVAASLNTSTYNLKIKSYRRIGNTAPAWNKAGLRDVIDSRF